MHRVNRFRTVTGATLAALTLVVTAGGAQAQPLGQIDFPTSGPPAAQEHFLKGVLQLHSFMYDDALEAFREAQEVAPEFAMAYWGEAMTYTHPIWVQQDRDAARAALARLGPTAEARLAKAPTEREKDYLRTVEVLYGEGDKIARDFAYADAMQLLAERYPEDLEAASFWALAVLGTCQYERDIPTYMRAASIVEEVFDKNPGHPGAAHYLIHSYDDPVHAPLGLRAARVYAKIAPAATHAQHMPSHIFVAMGMWDLNNASNVAAWEAADARMAAKGLSIEDRNYHALWWLEYGLLQQGRHREAREQLAIMEQDAAQSGSTRTRGHVAYMRAAYLVETRAWDGMPASPKTSDLALSAMASDLFANGVAAVETGDVAGATAALAKMRAARETTVAEHASDPAGLPPTTPAEIMEHELQALISLAEGREAEAVRHIEAATDLEDGMSLEFGPPVPVKPSHELYGEILARLGRHAEAQAEFAAALTRAPKRAASLLGLAMAASRAGDARTAEKAYDELRHQWQQADTPLPALPMATQGGGDVARR